MLLFFNTIKTEISRMSDLLYFAILALLCIVGCMLLINMIKNIAKNDDKIKIQLLPVIIFILILGIIVLFAVCRFA